MGVPTWMWITFKIIFPIIVLIFIGIIIIVLMGVDVVTAGWGIMPILGIAGLFIMTYILLDFMFNLVVIPTILLNPKYPLNSWNTWICYILYSLLAPGGFIIVPWELGINIDDYYIK